MTHFGDRLIKAAREFGPLCVGIDPHQSYLSREALTSLFGKLGPEALRRFGLAVIEEAKGKVAVVKPQAAFFEAFGGEGMSALQDICAAAREAGLIVIMDAKRGDIGSTVMGYVEAHLGASQAFAVDALTVNPYMGIETLKAFADTAYDNDRGIIVLARTSNPGAADFQEKLIDGKPLYMHVTEALQPMAEEMKGEETSWSSLMLVVGATAPEEARAIRKAAPNSPFLIPGYGAQGGGAEGAVTSFVKGPKGLEGGVVNASRSVTFPKASLEAKNMSEWRAAISEAILEAQADLLRAIRL